MIKVLFVLVWPVGIAVIAGAASLLARHASGKEEAGRGTAAAVVRPRGLNAQEPGTFPPPPGRTPGRHGPPGRAAAAAGPGGLAGAARLCLIAIVGTAAVLAVMVPLGVLAVHAGPAIDKPFYQWTIAHRVPEWASVMKRATKIGNSQATWAAAGTAAACLAVTWRRRRWLPPLALGALFAANKLAIHTLRHVIHRVGTPTAPLGTFPSGGTARSVVFYGLIAYLLWREFSGTRRGAVWATAAVVALGFNEGYSRGYLGLHWLTDILSGWVYGGLLLAVFIAAVRFAAGPARVSAGAGPGETAPPETVPPETVPAGAVPGDGAPADRIPAERPHAAPGPSPPRSGSGPAPPQSGTSAVSSPEQPSPAERRAARRQPPPQAAGPEPAGLA
jgi:membrane-associated phospholipid phosphatase